MPNKKLTAKIKNLARGKQKVRHLRYKIFNLLYTAREEDMGNIGDYLSQSMMALIHTEANVLFALQDKDFEILAKLSVGDTSTLNSNFFQLAIDYILKNIVYVTRMSKAEGRIATKLIDRDAGVRGSAFQEIDPKDRQSLIAFKLYASLHSTNQKEVTRYFSENIHSDWVKQRLIYPMMFMCMNYALPVQVNDYLVSSFNDHKFARVEQNVIRYLLFDDIDLKLSLAFKSYIALVSHPYDALEAIISHFEGQLSTGNPLSDKHRSLLTKLHKTLPTSRLATVLSIWDEREIPAIANGEALPIISELNLPNEMGKFLTSYISRPKSSEHVRPTGYELLDSLDQMRLNRYPTLKTFQNGALFARQYRFLKLGKLIGLFMSGLYMIDRENKEKERTDLLWQISFFGGVTEFTRSSPRFDETVSSGLLTCATPSEEESNISESGRWWIKDFHRDQYVYQAKSDFDNWFRACRNTFPIFCNSKFLSGIDWGWIAEIRKVARIKPFFGNPDAIYVLLIQQIEQSLSDSTTMKLAFKPFLDHDGQTSNFVTKLEDIYGSDATAFVVSFLTPTMILTMGLETSYTAALSARVEALEKLTEKFDVNDEILTLDQLSKETRELVTYLIYSAIGEEQFEIPWTSFRDIAETNATDIHNAYKMFHGDEALQKVLGVGKTKKSKVFANKKVSEYSFPNNQWPRVDVIISIINTFLSHPAYGIESILAVRIRHDNLRTEFFSAIEDAEKINVPGITSPKFASVSSEIQNGVFDTLQAWVDNYMHTPRGSAKGVFEFVPSQNEMSNLVSILDANDELKSIVSAVSSWLNKRLKQNLQSARELVDIELRKSLKDSIAATKKKLKISPEFDPNNIDKVSNVLANVVDTKCSEIMPWFRVPDAERIREITYGQMRYAVERRFYRDFDTGKIKLSFSVANLRNRKITTENIKCVFNIWSELVLNAKKYSARTTTRIRVTEYCEDGVTGFVFSSLLAKSEGEFHNVHRGSPVATTGSMLLKGKSGLKKVASLSATLVNAGCEIHVFKRKQSFHVFVPHEGN